MNLDAGQHRIERRRDDVTHRDSRHAEQHQLVTKRVGSDAPGQHVGGGDVREGVLRSAIAHQHLAVLFHRQRERAEAHRLDAGRPEADCGRTIGPVELQHRERERQRDAIAEADGERYAAIDAVRIREEVEIAATARGGGNGGKILRHRWRARHAIDVAVGCALDQGIRRLRRRRALVVTVLEDEEVPEDRALRVAHGIHQLCIVTLRRLQRRAHCGATAGIDCAVEPIQRARRGRRLRLHDVGADDGWTARGDEVDEACLDGARPGPAPDFRQALVVDGDDHYLGRRRLGTALQQARVERAQVEQVERPAAAKPQNRDAETDDERDGERGKALAAHWRRRRNHRSMQMNTACPSPMCVDGSRDRALIRVDQRGPEERGYRVRGLRSLPDHHPPDATTPCCFQNGTPRLPRPALEDRNRLADDVAGCCAAGRGRAEWPDLPTTVRLPAAGTVASAAQRTAGAASRRGYRARSGSSPSICCRKRCSSSGSGGVGASPRQTVVASWAVM